MHADSAHSTCSLGCQIESSLDEQNGLLVSTILVGLYFSALARHAHKEAEAGSLSNPYGLSLNHLSPEALFTGGRLRVGTTIWYTKNGATK